MTSKQRHKSKYQSVPQKPDLEISNYQVFDDPNETIVPGLDIKSGTDFKRSRGTDTSTDDYEELNAPVKLPSRDSLAIDLVPATLVFQLEEYRADESRLAALFFAFLGALLGFIATLSMTKPIYVLPTIIVGLLLLIVSIIFFSLMRIMKIRADNKINELQSYKRKQ
jgi:hypothetical protein